MGDDLSAFFAKKKKKKSGIINIDEVRNRLERKARRNELEEVVDDEENELVKLTRTTIEPMKSTNEGEDSEWIDWRDRPNFADLSIRQYIENDDNNEEENRVTKEPTKTWKNKEEAVKENIVVVAQPDPVNTLFVPRQKRVQETKKLDANNEMAANEVEKELKKIEQEEIDRNRVEQARIKENEKRREEQEAAKRLKFQAQREQRNATDSPDNTGMRQSRAVPEENDDNWRGSAKVPITMSPQRTAAGNTRANDGGFIRGGMEPARESHKTFQQAESQNVPTSQADEATNWRGNKPAAAPVKSTVTKTSETNKQEQGEEDTGSWRKVMPKKVTANSETMESKAPKKSANIYVPPPMREKEREK